MNKKLKHSKFPQHLEEIIKIFEKSLEKYKTELEKNQNNIFYQGLVKNTEEYISELKIELNKKQDNG